MLGKRYVFDTGENFNLIRRSAPLVGCGDYVDTTTEPPKPNYANGRPLALGESIWLTVRFGNTLLRVRFIVSERLAVEVQIVTALLIKQVLAILCTDQKVQFRNDEVPIVKKFKAGYDADLTPFSVRHLDEDRNARSGMSRNSGSEIKINERTAQKEALKG